MADIWTSGVVVLSPGPVRTSEKVPQARPWRGTPGEETRGRELRGGNSGVCLLQRCLMLFSPITPSLLQLRATQS